MDDREMMELCQMALGWKHLGSVGKTPTIEQARESEPKGLWCLSGQNDWWESPQGDAVCGPCSGVPYDFLHDDAQCFGLAKKFELLMQPFEPPIAERGTWWVACDFGHAEGNDLNRAICECVAKLHQAKSTG